MLARRGVNGRLPHAGLLLLAALLPGAACGAGVQALFDIDGLYTAPFPSDRFTVADNRQITGSRIDLPKPDCTANVSECRDIDSLNELDGFNVAPRLSVPFSGMIDPSTLDAKSVFLLEFGGQSGNPAHLGGALDTAITKVIGFNQAVWDPATTTLHLEANELLRQHAVHALVVTSSLRDAAGDPVAASPAFAALRAGTVGNDALAPYRTAVLKAVQAAVTKGLVAGEVVAASVFTTMSVTAVLEKIRAQIRAAPAPQPPDFNIGPGGMRAYFTVGAPLSIVHRRQDSTAPAFVNHYCSVNPGAAAGQPKAVAFGRFRAPNYLVAERHIPQVGTLTGAPQLLGPGERTIDFILHLPAGPKPAGGWPVAVFGHGYQSNKLLACATEQQITDSGIAVIAFNAIGHGGGPLGTFQVPQPAGTVEFGSDGRGEDRNGNGAIGYAEGMSAEGLQRLAGIRDGNRQTVVELMQLVRVIEAGIDADGDGARDLNPARIYYYGHSNGGNYGTLLMALEPQVRAAVLVAPGTLVGARLSPVFRPDLVTALGARVPPLLNAGAVFDENIPFRDQPPLVNSVAGAMKLQEYFDREEWMRQPGSSIAYAPHLQLRPTGCTRVECRRVVVSVAHGKRPVLREYCRPVKATKCPPSSKSPGSACRARGCFARQVLVQFVMGDKLAPNPPTSALLRAGGLVDRATYLRWDLYLAANGPVSWSSHDFGLTLSEPKSQIAAFFASDGQAITDPDGPATVWETPIAGPLPEATNYFP